MELVLTLILITFLVISVSNLIGLKAKTIAIATVLIDIAYIAIVFLTVDLSGVWEAVSTWLTDIASKIMEGLS